MAIYDGFSAVRIRPDAEPMYIHKNCNQELKSYGGLQGADQQSLVLKCDACDKILGEWPTEEDKRRELAEWVRRTAA